MRQVFSAGRVFYFLLQDDGFHCLSTLDLCYYWFHAVYVSFECGRRCPEG